MNPGNHSQLVAIVGGSGAGKSWLALRLCKLLGEKACHLALDDFYSDRSHLTPSRREALNFDTPTAIDWSLLDQVLEACRNGQTPTRVPRYDFLTHTRLSDREGWQPKNIVIVEGLWLLSRPALRRNFALSIFLDCPEPLRLRRRVSRDAIERGRSPHSVRRQFGTTLAPMHKRHVEPQRNLADLVLSQPYRQGELLDLADRFWLLLRAGAVLPEWIHASFRAEMLALVGSNGADHP